MQLQQHHKLATKKQTTIFWIRHKVSQFLAIPPDSERSQGTAFVQENHHASIIPVNMPLSQNHYCFHLGGGYVSLL